MLLYQSRILRFEPPFKFRALKVCLAIFSCPVLSCSLVCFSKSFVLPASVTACFSVRKSSGPASPAAQTQVTPPAGPQREQEHHHPPHAHHPHPMPKPPAGVQQHSVTHHSTTPPHHALPAPHHSTSGHHTNQHHSPGVVLISQKPLESHHSHGHNHIGERTNPFLPCN